MALVVEFFGLPGSGKSTLAREIAEGVERGGGSVARLPAPSAGAKLQAVARHRGVVIPAALILLRSPRPFGQKLQALRYVVVTLERYDAARADRSEDVHLFEEGSLQRLFMLLVEADGVRARWQERFEQAAPLADVLVHVVASPEELLRRLQQRDRGLPPRFGGLTADQAGALLIDADQMLAQAAGRVADRQDDDWRRRPRVLVSRVASHDVEAVLRHLRGVSPTHPRG